jgi:hypothetical protein
MPNIFELPNQGTTVSTITDAAATLTTDQLVNGLILTVPTAARTFTTPTATAILAAIDAPKVGAAFDLNIRNTSAGSFAITVAGGTGVTVVGTATTAQNIVSRFRGVVTGVDTPAVSLYRVGTGAA